MSSLALSSFQNNQFGEIRTLLHENGEPWFVAKDIATALGYSNPQKAIRDHCKGVNETFTPTAGGEQAVKIIPESDLYRLILRSKLPQAEAFQDWVTSEVLPSIRKHGVYKKDKKEKLTEDSFLEHNGSFWLSADSLAAQLGYLGIEEPADDVEISFNEHKGFLKQYSSMIDGKQYFRDYGIVYLLLIISVELNQKKDEIKGLCRDIEGLIESLKGRSTRHIKVAAVRAYQEVVSRITASGNDVSFIGNLIRYKRKELSIGEIAVLTGQKEDDVAVYLEELETSGIMDMADLLEGAAAPAVCLPLAPVKKLENKEEAIFSVSKELIKSIGFNEAMVLHQLQTMISQEKRGFVHITYKEWTKRFPFKSESSLIRAIRKLEDMGIVVSKRVFNNFQRVKEYRINDEALKKYAKQKLIS